MENKSLRSCSIRRSTSSAAGRALRRVGGHEHRGVVVDEPGGADPAGPENPSSDPAFANPRTLAPDAIARYRQLVADWQPKRPATKPR